MAKGITLGFEYETKFPSLVPAGTIGECLEASYDEFTGQTICLLEFPTKERFYYLNSQLEEVAE